MPMSPSLFAALAAGITMAGLALVVAGARLVGRSLPAQAKLLAAFCLVAYGLSLVVRPSSWWMLDLSVLTGAVGGVLLFQAGLRTPGAVAVFVAVAAAVDVWSMSGGLSRLLVERYRAGASDLLLYLALVARIRGHTVPVIGIGDLLVGGSAAVALLRLRLPPAQVAGGLAIGLLSALACGLWWGGAPALPFIAVAVLVVVWRNPHYSSKRRQPHTQPSSDPCPTV